MKDVKKEFRWFSITEYEKEAEYLRRRHKEGWKFKNVTYPGIYIFERLPYMVPGPRTTSSSVSSFTFCTIPYP